MPTLIDPFPVEPGDDDPTDTVLEVTVHRDGRPPFTYWPHVSRFRSSLRLLESVATVIDVLDTGCRDHAELEFTRQQVVGE